MNRLYVWEKHLPVSAVRFSRPGGHELACSGFPGHLDIGHRLFPFSLSVFVARLMLGNGNDRAQGFAKASRISPGFRRNAERHVNLRVESRNELVRLENNMVGNQTDFVLLMTTP